ncbi:NADH dehydrogenase [Caldovatus sediminis]|uniref:NADH dehydrogenase n=1 Tax=Caldovatus sediminis TaxID=2041189 RepID=A0A8J2ZCB7_9PROT|nr:nitroreductase family protein [Caldovatus sediminis]GGG36110.1 NADH dehydrogenase [Caldovatus sediminis]
MPSFFEVVAARRSARAFLARPIEPAALRSVLEAMVEAPSAGNLQAYRVILVETRETRNALAEAAHGQDFVAAAPTVLVFCADAPRSRARYGERGAALFALQDATIAASYAQLAATALGLGSCWVGAFDEARVARLLRLAAGVRPVAILALGHAAERPPRPPRRPVEALVQAEAH